MTAIGMASDANQSTAQVGNADQAVIRETGTVGSLDDMSETTDRKGAFKFRMITPERFRRSRPTRMGSP